MGFGEHPCYCDLDTGDVTNCPRHNPHWHDQQAKKRAARVQLMYEIWKKRARGDTLSMEDEARLENGLRLYPELRVMIDDFLKDHP